MKLEIRDLHAGYGAVRALMGVSLDMNQGQTVALLGTNGNGKSTLMKSLMGIVKPSAGEIIARVDGVELNLRQLTTEQIVNSGIALVPEGRHLFPKLTVAKNLQLGAYRHEARSELANSLAQVYEVFPRLKERQEQLAGSMSGGEQQMVAIGRALMGQPRLLLLDEPSHGLAPKIVQELHDALVTIHRSSVTTLLVEQNTQLALSVAQRALVLQNGEVVLSGRSEELLNDTRVREAYLGI